MIAGNNFTLIAIVASRKKCLKNKRQQPAKRDSTKLSLIRLLAVELKANFSFPTHSSEKGKRKLWRLAQKDTKINNITTDPKKYWEAQ